MITCINIDKYHQNIFNNIPYKYYRTILNILNFIPEDLLKKYYYINNYDNLCRYLLNYMSIKQKNIHFFLLFYIKNKSILLIKKYFILYNLKKKINFRNKKIFYII